MSQAADRNLNYPLPRFTGREHLGLGIPPIAALTKWLLSALVPIALLLSVPDPASSNSMPDVFELYQQSKKRGSYLSPDPEELDIVESLFARMLEGERGEQLAAQWRKLGYRLQRARLNNLVVLALSEDEKKKKGRGFYLFPLEQTGSSLLMIPHRFFDMHTGPIGLKLYAAGSFAGAAWNTVHRHKKSTTGNGFRQDNDNLPNWDLADLEGSYFTALTRAFNRTFPQGHLIQVHGFSREKRNSWEGRDSDVILANGTMTPPQDLIEFADCLKLKMGVMVRVYPHEIRDLGAMENVSARITDNFGNRGFIQMEMSLGLRLDILKSKELNKVITGCMQESWY
ncbi:MAG: hypothetical protein KJN87_09820 [Desulfofustis sp.]|nr:hypothetical protein [Desulfofustis sp.]